MDKRSEPRIQRFGRYQVETELGRGGMSVVYRARDPALERPVAVKVLHPHLADREESRTRFTREAKAVARLQHPSIVEVYDYSPADSEQAYIVTEFIDGPTLRQLVDAHPIRHAEVAALLMIPVLQALGHAHAAGVVHRDVKPENVMLRPDGTPVLMDFGIAQMVDQDTLTATGTMLGSPAHMAPEVVEGEEISARSDLFSIGTVLYWLVCGVLPFVGPNPAALFRRIAEGRYDPVLTRRPQAGRAIARLIERCMARRPEDRPASADEVITGLREILTEGGLGEPMAELREFLKDPEGFQEQLTWRLVPAYLALAEKAWAKKQSARALDFLDRVLSLDEREETARALLRRIERGQRHGRAARVLVAAVVLGGLAGGIFLLISRFWTSGVDLGVGLLQPPPETPTSSLPPKSPDAGVPRSVDAQVVDAGPLDAAPPSAPPRDASPLDARVVGRPVRPPVGPTARPDAAVPAPRTLALKVRGPQRAEVYLEGTRQGYLYEVQVAGGLQLTTGRTYVVGFKNPGCEDKEHRINVTPDQVRIPDLPFTCDWKQAYLKVDSNIDAMVLRGDGKYLGRTRSPISVPMNGGTAQLAIVVTDGVTNQTRDLTLNAGQETKVTANF